MTLKPIRPSRLGIGLGLRHQLLDDILQARQSIDWLEIIPENYMGRGGVHLEALERCLDAGFPIISHGVGLSIGSVDPLDDVYLTQLKALFARIQPRWFSDHLCFSSIDNVHLHDLLPLPFTWEAVEHVVKKIRLVQQQFEIPFLIENGFILYQFQHQEMTEASSSAKFWSKAIVACCWM